MTYNEETAEVEPRTKEEWLDLILEDGSEHWGEDITERDGTAVHHFFEPFAGRLEELEQRLRTVQHSLRLNDAEGQALNYLGERFGVDRLQASRATGQVTFSRDTAATKDYLIKEGTLIETGGLDSIEFQTTEGVILANGTTSVTSDIEAREFGSKANVAADTISQAVKSISGVDSITNTEQITGGRNLEQDEAYRDRIRTSIGEIDVSSLKGLYNELNAFEFIKEVQPIDNSTDVQQDSLNPHEVEVVVDSESGYNDQIAQTIFENMAMGANLVSGVHGASATGTATLSNGQTFTIDYSTPAEVTIYVDTTVIVEEDVNTEELINSLVEYVGGVKTNGEQVYGEVSVGEDVLYGELDYALRSVNNVYDIDSLKVGTSSSPTGTSNVAINQNDRAVLDASNVTVSQTSK